nr:hypothetical protein [uncultured Flavobacterium sp.]
MEEFKTRLLERYDNFITELERIDTEYREFLNKATSKGNFPEQDMVICMAFAKENHRRLQFAIAERETLN